MADVLRLFDYLAIAVLFGFILYYASLDWQGSPTVASASAFVLILVILGPAIWKELKN